MILRMSCIGNVFVLIQPLLLTGALVLCGASQGNLVPAAPRLAASRLAAASSAEGPACGAELAHEEKGNAAPQILHEGYELLHAECM